MAGNSVEPRENIGRNVIYWALAAITVIGVVALIAAAIDSTQRVSGVKDVLALLLPVIGAWVGTVLAFYFGRENYLAASRSTEAILALTLEQKLEKTKASEAMRPIDKIVALRTADADAAIKLKDRLLDLMSDEKSRLPVLNPQGVARYIVHRSAIDRFIATRAIAGATPEAIAALTLADLVAQPEIKSVVTAFGVVSPDDSLALVKQKLDADPKCQDVFVTEGGARDQPIRGWLTNNAMLELAKA
ncbi:MAG: hypothetical protein RR101_04170 [Burkholderiaceae bacterium]